MKFQHHIAATILLVVSSSSGWSETPDASRARDSLSAAETELGTSRNRETQLATEVAALLKEQEDLSARLIEAADEVTLHQQALSETGNRISALDKERLAIRTEIHAKRAVLAELLAGLQRLEQDPPPALVVAPGRSLDALRGAMMFGAVVPELRDEADHLMNRLTRLEDIKRESSQARIDARDQIVAVQASQAAIAALLEKRKAVLAEQEKTLAGERSHLRELANRVSNLKQLLAALAEQESAKSAEQHAADAELARQTALLQRPHVRLQHSRGALEYPAQGAILAHFGDDNGLGGVLNGVAISVDAKGLVRSPADASVVFAGPFRSYGQLLILDAGDGYLVLMAGVGQMNVSVGQTVRAGEPLGLMAEKGAPAAVLATGVPDQHAVLYVEIRKNGEPVDSTDWWLGSRKEAMQ